MKKVSSLFKKIIQSKPIMMALFLVCSIVGIGFGSGNVHAAVPNEFTMKPGETGNVYYDTSNVYMMYGTRNGQPWSDATAPMAVKPDDGGIDIMTFCVQPGVPFISSDNPGYQAVSANDIPRDAKIASIIWNNPDLGICGDTNENDRIVTQSVIWELLPYGIHVDDIPRIPNYAQRKALLYQKIAEYNKRPEFNGKTIELTYGESKTLTSSVNLNSFETQVVNSAKVNWSIAPDGKSVTVTPTDLNVQSGIIAYKRSFMEGTPIALEKKGSQRVFIPSTDDPASYSVKFNIKTFGEFKIKKIDKETGNPVPGTRFKLEYSNLPNGVAGPAIPTQTEVVTDQNGLSPKIKALNGIHVKATETFVPAPYVLGSAIGDSDVVEGDIVAGQTITLTQRNKKAKGQIIVEKSGVESGKDMWNGNYSLAGNVFEIHENDASGKVVATVTTDVNGHAETNKELPLGTYVVTEKTASNGFANTFKPVTVKIEYANQTTAVIVKGAEGTNQEVVGSTLLTKEDVETGKETQGRATFDGAQYGLFHEDGTPVKWSDNFKPTTSKGNKLEGNEVKFELSDEEQQASVEHLALGKYYWQETKAPEGYQIDNTKREFEITYKDQDTQVIATESISKENVIKFTLDGFKYVKSQSGSTQSGYNGIELKLTPIEPTKGEARTVKTETDANGYDGYWKFEGVPYGDYDLEEVKAPEGYELITPLTIRSSFDEEKHEYTFTITEKGSKEPLKVVTKTEQEINEGSNVIHLSKLFLVDEHARVPEQPEISTLFVTKEGEKTFNPTVDQNLIDKVDNKFDKLDVGKTFYYVTQFHKIDKDGKDTVVGTVESERKVEKEEFSFDVEFDYKANTLKHGEKIVATHLVYSDKEHTDEYARHFDLSNEKQTLEAVTPGMPTIETLFVTKDGGKTFDPTIDNELIDEVKATVPKEDIGKTFYYVTQFHKIDKDGKVTVVGTDESEHKADEMSYEFKSVYNYKANTLKDGEKLVATHIAYTDKEHKNEYAKHFDLNNSKQTLTAKTPTKPVVSKSTIAPKQSLPKTGEIMNNKLILLGLILLVSVGTVVSIRRKAQK
ncbi:SpaA isopeptide-forming pilin-related protein [Enterococcus hirae]|uniref:SpaA isopeptide-forming pilin-related protein n=1 Tax=Enterococcus hirae TaxID=1354 RepID=UPI002DBF9081|nr:SpaA isopeptide-forming pilin-related protein [Enterococcus hirae]MEB7518787.1 SpaA isopeptide-forming pilin-related protein [Enterococcus hirae]